MVQTTLGNSSISAGCGILAISISIAALTIVLCRRIGVLDIPLGIGSFFGVVTLVAAFKTDHIGIAGEVVEVSSGTVIVIGAVEIVWVVREIGAWSLGWTIGRPGVLLKDTMFLAARAFLSIHPPLATFIHRLALGLQLDGFVHQ